MTREELEEGRRLLAEFRADEARATANGHSRELLGTEIEDWLLAHSDELLALAEGARWRKSSEELPEGNVYVVALHENGFITDRLFYDGKWSVHGSKPTHWRPLPKPPEKP